MSRVRLLVVDLDHTLFDWVASWAASTRTLLARGAALTGVPVDVLTAALADLHRLRGSTEPDDPLGALECLSAWIGDDAARRQSLRTAWIEARARGRASLRPLPGVVPALANIHAAGTAIAVCSEASPALIAERLDVLGLRSVVDAIAPAGHDAAPAGDYPTLSVRAHKPDPQVLHAIATAAGVGIGEVLCVGDHLHKDVGMAQAAGARDAWAAYGLARDPDDLSLLAQLAHWGPGDVDTARYGPAPTPTITLWHSLAELLPLFEFSGATFTRPADARPDACT